MSPSSACRRAMGTSSAARSEPECVRYCSDRFAYRDSNSARPMLREPTVATTDSGFAGDAVGVFGLALVLALVWVVAPAGVWAIAAHVASASAAAITELAIRRRAASSRRTSAVERLSRGL